MVQQLQSLFRGLDRDPQAFDLPILPLLKQVAPGCSHASSKVIGAMQQDRIELVPRQSPAALSEARLRRGDNGVFVIRQIRTDLGDDSPV